MFSSDMSHEAQANTSLSGVKRKIIGNESEAVKQSAVEPLDSDILLGRGSAHSVHPGNANLHHYVVQNLKKYQAGTRRERQVLIHKMLEQLREHGLRFLKCDGKQWFQVDVDVQYNKIRHAFRYQAKVDGVNLAPSYETTHTDSQSISQPTMASERQIDQKLSMVPLGQHVGQPNPYFHHTQSPPSYSSQHNYAPGTHDAQNCGFLMMQSTSSSFQSFETQMSHSPFPPAQQPSALARDGINVKNQESILERMHRSIELPSPAGDCLDRNDLEDDYSSNSLEPLPFR